MASDTRVLQRVLADLAATEKLARALAGLVRRGDVIGLAGELGAGKTTFARAFLRARAGAEREEVPSPTFTLAQAYDLPGLPVWHFDLYRLAKAEDAFELGIEEAFAEGVSLIEWPGRLGRWLPVDRLDIVLTQGPLPDARSAMLVGRESWARRLDELEALEAGAASDA